MFRSSLLFLTMMVVSSTSALLMMPPIMQHDAHHRSTTTLFYQDATEAPSTEPTTTLVAKQKPKSIWLESTALEKAVACAESADTCPVDELEDLANGTNMKLVRAQSCCGLLLSHISWLSKSS